MNIINVLYDIDSCKNILYTRILCASYCTCDESFHLQITIIYTKVPLQRNYREYHHTLHITDTVTLTNIPNNTYAVYIYVSIDSLIYKLYCIQPAYVTWIILRSNRPSVKSISRKLIWIWIGFEETCELYR